MLKKLLKFIDGGPGPSPVHTLLEARALLEPLGLVTLTPLLAKAPRGDGHPVLVLPGFTASDKETQLLRHFLESLGYRVHGWSMGRNIGPMAGLEKRAVEKVRALAETYDDRVSLVGWSMGGLFARYIAQQQPELVRNVITLGSPVGFRRDVNVLSPAFAMALSGMVAHDIADLIDDNSIRHWHHTPPVPTTALFSYTDGIAHWSTTLDPLEHERAENVHVPGTHSGMTHNALVFLILADRLAQAEGQWQPFAYRGLSALVYGLLSPFKAVV